MKRLFLLLPLFAACQKHPDAPPPAQAQVVTQPPPVTNCQLATVPFQLPIYDQDDATHITTVIPGFDVSCGDTVDVLIRGVQLAPTDPWTTLLNDPRGSSYYTINGQSVTVFNNTSSRVHVSLSGVLK